VRAPRRPSTAVVAAGIAVVALVLAGFVSYYAASTPDGLTQVSQQEGFADTETDHAAGEGPFAGYETGFLDDDRLSGGVAGVVGVLVVLTLGSGLVLAVRRRPGRDEPRDTADTADTEPTSRV